ncbi:MAG TPA: hypothetical protein VF276_02240, partial [Chloroflexia bacterium]
TQDSMEPSQRAKHAGTGSLEKIGLLCELDWLVSLCVSLLAHHSAVVKVLAWFYRSRERQGVLYQMEKPCVKALFHNLSTDLSATLSTELWITGAAGRQAHGHTKTGAYNAGRTITVMLIRVPRLAVPLRSIFSARPNETGIGAAFHSGFGIIPDRVHPVKGFRRRFCYQFCGRC